MPAPPGRVTPQPGTALSIEACPVDRGTASRSGRVLNYPGRCSGVGLFLLRATVGITVGLHAWMSVASTNPDLLGAVPAVALIMCGVALIVGIFTPVCSTIVAIAYVIVLITPFGGMVLPRVDTAEALAGLATAAALGLLGPGAFSIDARLLGRRQIFIPAKEDDSAQA
jgi:uncharacterized membrane protein YphA (DoxX/SURF4 family)